MRNLNLPYNPVFESLSDQAKKYTREPQFIIYEQQGDGMAADKVQEYALLIIETLQNNVFKFIQSAPFQDLRDATMPALIEKAQTLKKNASLQDLVESLYDSWKKCYQSASSHKRKDMIIPFYNKINEGIDSVMKAWATLKEKAGDKLSGEELLNLVNSKMSDNMDSFLSEIKKAKEKLDAEVKK
jgi:hypothetical protein